MASSASPLATLHIPSGSSPSSSTTLSHSALPVRQYSPTALATSVLPLRFIPSQYTNVPVARRAPQLATTSAERWYATKKANPTVWTTRPTRPPTEARDVSRPAEEGAGGEPMRR